MNNPTVSFRVSVEDAFERQLPEDRSLATDQWDTHYHDIGIDSLDHVELIMDLEKEFDIQIPDKIVADLTTPNKILKYLESL